MRELFPALQDASRAGRRAIAQQVVHGLMSEDLEVGRELTVLCSQLISVHLGSNPIAYDEHMGHTVSPGEFGAEKARWLLLDVNRLGGFLRAIDRVPQASKGRENLGIDAGCGPIPILAMGGALLQRSGVVAYEINPGSAAVAEAATELFGLDDRITIVRANALDPGTGMPADARYAVSETYGRALLAQEPGPQITQRLAELGVEHVIPWSVRLSAIDVRSPDDDLSGRHQIGSLTFATDNLVVSGSFPSNDRGARVVLVGADFYDRAGNVIISGDDNHLSHPGMAGATFVPNAGDIISVSYPAGGNVRDVALQVTPGP